MEAIFIFHMDIEQVYKKKPIVLKSINWHSHLGSSVRTTSTLVTHIISHIPGWIFDYKEMNRRREWWVEGGRVMGWINEWMDDGMKDGWINGWREGAMDWWHVDNTTVWHPAQKLNTPSGLEEITCIYWPLKSSMQHLYNSPYLPKSVSLKKDPQEATSTYRKSHWRTQLSLLLICGADPTEISFSEVLAGNEV